MHQKTTFADCPGNSDTGRGSGFSEQMEVCRGRTSRLSWTVAYKIKISKCFKKQQHWTTLDEARQDKTEAKIPKYLSEVRIFKIKVTFIDAQAAKPSGAVKGQGGG